MFRRPRIHLAGLLPVAVLAFSLQVGCGGPPENTAMEPPEDFKFTPIEKSNEFNSSMDDAMNPGK
ncbi:MAG: hypothetical protein ACF787_13035 [Rhodopirellula sp. JB053]|uniref:hypothetical protein n=1 Tax=Rhodopirellula sp. JB044 TaxID=3342844 RepID=UPI00370C55A6